MIRLLPASMTVLSSKSADTAAAAPSQQQSNSAFTIQRRLCRPEYKVVWNRLCCLGGIKLSPIQQQIEALCAKGKTGLFKGFIPKQGKPFEAYLTLGEETGWNAQFRFESGR